MTLMKHLRMKYFGVIMLLKKKIHNNITICWQAYITRHIWNIIELAQVPLTSILPWT